MFGFFKKKNDALIQEIEKTASTDQAVVLPKAELQTSWLDRLKSGMSKTRSGLNTSFSSLFTKPSLSPEDWETLEEELIQCDLGIATVQEFLAVLKQNPPASVQELKTRLKAEVVKALDLPSSSLQVATKPFSVFLMVGINGVGKTTTTAKLAHLLTGAKRKVVLAAGDTFRAGAVDQLKVWGSRLGLEVVCGSDGQDPASVAFEGLKKAGQSEADILIIDTAGRLHTQANLMEEMAKISRVIEKNHPGGAQETLMVLDATTGQNAIQQARIFHKAVKLTGLVITKLDGTARGGVVLQIQRELKVPIRFIGVGEKAEDLEHFDAREFAEALFEG